MSDVQTSPAPESGDTRRTSRREFLRLAGFGGVALMLPTFAAGCTNEDPTDPKWPAAIDLSTDEGLIDFAYVVAQLRWELYWTMRHYSPFAGMTALEAVTFNSIANHNASYKNLLSKIGGGRIPPAMRFDFGALNFSARSSVYEFALELEERVAGGFAWAVAHARTDEVLTLMGKLASVSGRHAAVLRDLADIHAGHAATSGRVSFANDAAVSPATGLHRLVSPAEVIEFLRPHIVTTVTVRGA